MATQSENVNYSILIVSIVISVLLFVNIVLGAQVFFYTYQNTIVQELIYDQPFTEYNTLAADQQEDLYSYTIDPQANRFSIPIDQAMQKVIQKYGEPNQQAMTE
jgi:hypothetical protein